MLQYPPTNFSNIAAARPNFTAVILLMVLFQSKIIRRYIPIANRNKRDNIGKADP